MLTLTKQEKLILLFLITSAVLGIGILCCKNLIYKPGIEVIPGPVTEKEIKSSKVIDINTAAKEGLMRLKGVGPSLADAIIEYRISHGPFKDKEELKGVKGIGQAKYDGIKENIKVE